MKVMIHACPARMWYVERFPAPSLRAQGIEPLIFCDTERRGNLGAFLASIRELHGDGECAPAQVRKAVPGTAKSQNPDQVGAPLAVW